jgi:dihydropteroate synthase
MNTGIPEWRLAPGRAIPLDRPRIMAILNATPDSFSDPGLHLDPDRALASARAFVRDGADILDIGAESTRPGSRRVDADEQLRRILPVIRAIRADGLTTPISVDTTLSAVAGPALDAGADAVNDVSGGEDDPAILDLAARRACGLILMHRPRPPEQDRYSDAYETPPDYADVVRTVREALGAIAGRALGAGCDRAAIVLDPGLGFGKSVEQNAELVRAVARLGALGFPILGAASRKSFVARLAMGEHDAEPPPPEHRLPASIAFSIALLAGGVRLFRVHDVREQARALRAAWALGIGRDAGGAGPAK